QEDHAGRKRGAPQLVQRVRAIRGDQRTVVAVRQDFDDGATDVGVVFDDENGPLAPGRGQIRACGTRRRPAAEAMAKRGSSTTNVAPSPAMLSTEMVPRCASTMWRVM